MYCLCLVAQLSTVNDYRPAPILLAQDMENAMRKTLRLKDRKVLGGVAGNCYQCSHRTRPQDRVMYVVNAEECSIVRLSMRVIQAVTKDGSPAIADSVTGDLAVWTPCSDLPD